VIRAADDFEWVDEINLRPSKRGDQRGWEGRGHISILWNHEALRHYVLEKEMQLRQTTEAKRRPSDGDQDYTIEMQEQRKHENKENIRKGRR
jgi:hypothetical protein